MVIVFNPAAGRRRTQLLWRVLDVMATNGVKLEIAETRHPGHATELAREAAGRGARLVVAAGGDGTIAEVANGLAGSDSRLGIIPLGTANVLAHELGLSFLPSQVAASLAFGRTKPVWPGIAEGEGVRGRLLFVQMVGSGFDAQVVHRLSRPLKRAIGKGAYVMQTMRELVRYRFPRIRVTVDGHATEAGGVIVTKGHLYAGRYTLAPGATPCERGFTVALFDRAGPLSTLMHGAALPFDMIPRMPGVRLIRASVIDIESEHVPTQADGDPAGTGRLQVHDAAVPMNVVMA